MKKKDIIENFMAASTPGGIESQEKRGQEELVNSKELPKEILYATREDFERLGFKFGKSIDDLFIQAELPKGWRKKPSDHSMWSDIVDQKGIKRVAVFYKAAFYDRRAHMQLTLAAE